MDVTRAQVSFKNVTFTRKYPCVLLHAAVYGFFATVSDRRLLSDTSVEEGTNLTVYFGMVKGILPSPRRVLFATESLTQGQSANNISNF